jgi:hypothetical protein
MTRLPTYADNATGRALISEIIAKPPESRPIRDDWGTRDYPRYSGKPAALLRRLRSEWWEANHEGATSLPENPDALIQRLLAESEQSQARAA